MIRYLFYLYLYKKQLVCRKNVKCKNSFAEDVKYQMERVARLCTYAEVLIHGI